MSTNKNNLKNVTNVVDYYSTKTISLYSGKALGFEKTYILPEVGIPTQPTYPVMPEPQSIPGVLPKTPYIIIVPGPCNPSPDIYRPTSPMMFQN